MFGSTKKLKEEKYDLNLFKWRSKLLKPQMLFFLTGIMVWFEAERILLIFFSYTQVFNLFQLLITV